jgi:hypothetical protein
MPVLGEIRKGRDIGYRSRDNKYIWHACTICGKEQWVALSHKKPISINCRRCSSIKNLSDYCGVGIRNPKWKGGRFKDTDGYIKICLPPDNFYFPMATTYSSLKRYAAEHRIIMAKSLGRCLQSWEFVHHKNGIRDDNRIENLELTTSGAHLREHNKGYRDGFSKGMRDGRLKQIEELKREILSLKLQRSNP